MSLNQERPSYINFSSASDMNSTSRMNLGTSRSTATSRINTACSSRIYNPPVALPSAAPTARARPTTAYVSKKTSIASSEELRTPYKASLIKYHPPAHKRANINDLCDSSLSSRNFAVNLQVRVRTAFIFKWGPIL